MREDALRSILLVKAVEEADREGTLLPAADRAAATRDAVRERGESTAAADTALCAGQKSYLTLLPELTPAPPSLIRWSLGSGRHA